MCHPSLVSRALVRIVVYSLEEVWLWGAVVVGLGRPTPAFLTGREVRVRRPGGISRGGVKEGREELGEDGPFNRLECIADVVDDLL